MTPEGKVVAIIRKRIKSAGGLVRKCEWSGVRGAPDLFVMLNGHHCWIEAKAETGRVAPHQAREHERMRHAGCQVHIVRGEAEADTVVELIEFSKQVSALCESSCLGNTNEK